MFAALDVAHRQHHRALGWFAAGEALALVGLIGVTVSVGLALLVDRRAGWGALSLAACALVLWAQTRGTLAPIAALRETSAIIGELVLHELSGRWRIIRPSWSVPA
jgi:hypothetical protein